MSLYLILGYTRKLPSIHKNEVFLVYSARCSVAWSSQSSWYCCLMVPSPLPLLWAPEFLCLLSCYYCGTDFEIILSWPFTGHKGFGVFIFFRWIIFTINLFCFSEPISFSRVQPNKQTLSKGQNPGGSWRKQILRYNSVTKLREQSSFAFL